MSKVSYPKIYLRSKNELAKRLSSKNFSKEESLCLINDCLKNKDKYWKDYEEMSEPEENKYVRNASRTNLGKILKLVDKRLIKSYDNLLPKYIFGGVSEKSHVEAVGHLLGNRRKRTLMIIDLKSFFEQIPQHRINNFFNSKTQVSKEVVEILSELCCVPVGPKGNNGKMVIARGFPTSSRLAIWTNMNIFNKLYEIVNSELKGHDPRISIYVDDIGISASRVTDEQMIFLRAKINNILNNFDNNHGLIINNDKSKIIHDNENQEFLGIRLLRNKLAVGKISTLKRFQTRNVIKNSRNKFKRDKLKKKYKGMQCYKRQIESFNSHCHYSKNCV